MTFPPSLIIKIVFLLLLVCLYVYFRYNCSVNNGIWDNWLQICLYPSGTSGYSCPDGKDPKKTCLKNGEWVNGGCVCNPGKFGTLCERSCSDTTTCSGNGKCSTDGYCICNDGFSGKACTDTEKCPIGSFIKKPCNGKFFGKCLNTGVCSCRNKTITKKGINNCDIHGTSIISGIFSSLKSSTILNTVFGMKCPAVKALDSEKNEDGSPDYDKIIERLASDLAVTAYHNVINIKSTFEIKESVKKVIEEICKIKKPTVPSSDTVPPVRPIPTSTDNTPFYECVPSTRVHTSHICCETGAHPVADSEGDVHCFWDDDPKNPLPKETATSGEAKDCFYYRWGPKQEFVRSSPDGKMRKWTLGEDGYRIYEPGTVLQRIYGKSEDDSRKQPVNRKLADRLCEMENVNPKLLAELNTALAYGGCAELPKGYSGSISNAPS